MGGRGNGAARNTGSAGSAVANKNVTGTTSVSKSANEDLATKIANTKYAKNAGKYLQTPEDRAKAVNSMRNGDLLNFDYKTSKGNTTSMLIQRENDVYYIGRGDDMRSGSAKKVINAMENQLKGGSTLGKGAFLSRGWDSLQNIPYDYDENKPLGEEVTYRRDRIKKLR